MNLLLWTIGLVGLVSAHAEGGKYPDCVANRVLKEGDKFDLQIGFDKKSADVAKVLYRMGNNSVLAPEFPRVAKGMSIYFSVKPNPNEGSDPKELDRMARAELAESAQLKGAAIYCR